MLEMFVMLWIIFSSFVLLSCPWVLRQFTVFILVWITRNIYIFFKVFFLSRHACCHFTMQTLLLYQLYNVTSSLLICRGGCMQHRLPARSRFPRHSSLYRRRYRSVKEQHRPECLIPTVRWFGDSVILWRNLAGKLVCPLAPLEGRVSASQYSHFDSCVHGLFPLRQCPHPHDTTRAHGNSLMRMKLM